MKSKQAPTKRKPARKKPREWWAVLPCGGLHVSGYMYVERKIQKSIAKLFPGAECIVVRE